MTKQEERGKMAAEAIEKRFLELSREILKEQQKKNGEFKKMKYTLIWADNGAILDNKIVCDSIQEAYEAKKKYQRSVRLMVSPSACVTMWAVEYDAERPIVNDRDSIIYSGLRHLVIAELSRLNAFKTSLRLKAENCKNVRVYEYVRQIID